jgi:hypothetical protein
LSGVGDAQTKTPADCGHRGSKKGNAAASWQVAGASQMNGDVSMAGYRRNAKTGDDGVAISGNNGIAESGHRGTSIAGDCGTAIAGDWGMAIARDCGIAQCGHWGIIQIRRWGAENRGRFKIAYVGEGGIEPNVPYRLDAAGEFERVEPKTEGAK